MTTPSARIAFTRDTAARRHPDGTRTRGLRSDPSVSILRRTNLPRRPHEQDPRHWSRRAPRAQVVDALGESECIRASRNSGERVDISDPKSLAAFFERVGELDGIVCTGGAARYKPGGQLTDEDWTFSLANKLMGQVNVVRYGVKTVRSGGAITLTTGLAAQFPSPGSAIITTVNAAVEAFVRAAAAEPSLPVRVNAVSPGWVSETLQAMGRNPSDGIPAAEVAKVMVRQLREGPTGSVAPAAKV